jgi:hypothetical protein
MNRTAETEKPRSWKSTNDTMNPLGARHGLIAGNLPLASGGEWRKLARLDETEELLAGNIGVCPVRHRGGGVSGGLGAQEAVALRSERARRAGCEHERKKMMGK